MAKKKSTKPTSQEPILINMGKTEEEREEVRKMHQDVVEGRVESAVTPLKRPSQ